MQTDSNFSNSEVAIKVSNLSKAFHIYDKPRHRLQEMLRPVLGKIHSRFDKQYGREFWALKNISFEVKRGETFGIIGKNGAGKSTLLQIIAGTLSPTQGDVYVKGRINALLELGSGFNPEFSGRENVYLNGSILGFSNKEIDEKFQSILDFSEIGEFIDQPVKTYSSGMFVRLAFSVQAFLEPEILIVDEALAVGDIFFVQKCHQRIEDLLRKGNTTFLFVTHDIGSIEKYCKRALYLDHGINQFIGESKEAVVRYYQSMYEGRSIGFQTSLDSKEDQAEKTHDKSSAFLEEVQHFNEAKIDLENCKFVGDLSLVEFQMVGLFQKKYQACFLFEVGECANFFMLVKALKDLPVFIPGIEIRNSKNMPVFAKTALQMDYHPSSEVKKGESVLYSFQIQLNLAPGEYTVQYCMNFLNWNDFLNASSMSTSELYSKYLSDIRLLAMQGILITEKKQGIRLPFYGVTDLPSHLEFLESKPK